MLVNFHLHSSHARAPEYATTGSAALDFFSNSDDIVIKPNCLAIISTGITVTWTDPNCYLQLLSKSGLASRGIRVEAGVIDYDYQQEIRVILFNFSNEEITIPYQSKICQGSFIQKPMVMRYTLSTVQNGLVSTCPEFIPYTSQKRQGGFGSTGV